MKLPRGDRLKIEQIEEKLIRYALNSEHSDGKHKARLFNARLGIDLNNRKILIEALVDVAQNHDSFSEKDSPYGKKYVADFELKTQQGSSQVRSAWIIRLGASYPSLTTVYPL